MSDWDSVTVLRKRQPKASAMKTEGAINQVPFFIVTLGIDRLNFERTIMLFSLQARRQGMSIDTTQKCTPLFTF